MLLAAVLSAGKHEFNALVDNTNGDYEKKKRENDKAPVQPAVTALPALHSVNVGGGVHP